ncbi:MAG: DegV family protein [Culicoidibacterales bacterium]
MKKIAFLVDSTLAISQKAIEEHKDFFFIPLYVILNGKPLKDMVDISADEFYQAMRDGHTATTSQVSAGEFLQKYEEIKALGYTDIFVFTLTSKMSGTMHSATVAGQMIENCDVHVIETAIVTAVGSIAVYEVAKFAANNSDINAIKKFSDNIFSRLEILVYIDNLDTLKKGGRISATKAVIGNMLQIKPLLTIKDGVIDVIGKERTFKKALKSLVVFAQARTMERAIILHSSRPELRDAFIALFEENFPDIPYEVSDLSPVVGVHAGPEAAAIGVIWS